MNDNKYDRKHLARSFHCEVNTNLFLNKYLLSELNIHYRNEILNQLILCPTTNA